MAHHQVPPWPQKEASLGEGLVLVQQIAKDSIEDYGIKGTLHAQSGVENHVGCRGTAELHTGKPAGF